MMHLGICIPSMDLVHADFAMSLLGMQNLILQRPPRVDMEYNIYNERGSLIQLSRHKLAERCVQDGCTHMLFLDSDMTFPADSFHRLLARNHPVVGCNYVKRTIPATSNTVSMDDKMLLTTEDKTGLEPARSAGFGVLLIDVDVLRQVPPPWFDCVWMTNGELMGEDVFFFKKLAHHGFTLMIDHDLSKEIGHIGQFEYTNNLCYATFDELGIDTDGVVA